MAGKEETGSVPWVTLGQSDWSGRTLKGGGHGTSRCPCSALLRGHCPVAKQPSPGYSTAVSQVAPGATCKTFAPPRAVPWAAALRPAGRDGGWPSPCFPYYAAGKEPPGPVLPLRPPELPVLPGPLCGLTKHSQFSLFVASVYPAYKRCQILQKLSG